MSRRAKAVMIMCAFGLTVLAVCGVAATVNLGRTLEAADVEGAWKYESNGHAIELRINADGSFTAARWPQNLGCLKGPWPSRVADVTWGRTVRYEGTWSVGDITGRAINLRGDPSGNCSITTGRVRFVEGHSLLRPRRILLSTSLPPTGRMRSSWVFFPISATGPLDSLEGCRHF